jgi:hypothetical protein
MFWLGMLAGFFVGMTVVCFAMADDWSDDDGEHF